jgi:hypothetical protein
MTPTGVKAQGNAVSNYKLQAHIHTQLVKVLCYYSIWLVYLKLVCSAGALPQASIVLAIW